ncbi:PEP-CTERM sorting domain-containing protein [Cerasicoccus frondis]|uniref:PEP-CTERM sorting domain-containing protein n=1 Tax=Cerasicoccus frondis TaxID=490090 RepID=UPI002852A686|nr:PEP-CTERM sorting domain-containing protein [Cerasicoccus frondis]
MKKTTTLASAFFAFTVCSNAAVILNETFDNANGFTKADGSGINSFDMDSVASSPDYIGLAGANPDFDQSGTESNPVGLDDWLAVDGVTPLADDNTFFAGEDLDAIKGEHYDNDLIIPYTLTWSNIDIADYTNIQFSGQLGSTTNVTATDYLTIEYRIDDATDWSTLLDFQGNANSPGVMGLVGGTAGVDDLGTTLKTFTTIVSGTGSSMDLRISIDGYTGGAEAFAADNFILTGTTIPEPGTYAILVSLLSLGVVLVRRRK